MALEAACFTHSHALQAFSLWRTFCLSSDKIVELRWQRENWVTLSSVKRKRNYGKYLYAQCISSKSHPDARNCIKHVYCFTSLIIEIESVHQYICFYEIWIRQWRDFSSLNCHLLQTLAIGFFTCEVLNAAFSLIFSPPVIFTVVFLLVTWPWSMMSTCQSLCCSLCFYCFTGLCLDLLEKV